MPPTFRLRPGTASDLTHAVRLYDACLGSDKLAALLFPRKNEDPESYKKYLYRLYAKRYWSVEWTFTFIVKEGGESEDEDDTVVGFSCWKRPSADITFGERWFTLFAWIAPLVRTFISLQDTLLAPLNIDPHAAHAFDRVFPPIEKALFADKNRAEWWYLSTLAVHPSVQGIGLGALLLGEGLTRADEGKVWLIGLRGTDAYYSRFGFVEVGRANVGDLSEWDGGIVMFRE
ncbi:acyl-CoA N-acyltransferase [Trichoderma citrinoviride]|uniref:Acyl-CoA N-acyltransferase n=1 Tax=Trichoderma citrinoviride TaxID=58853 RepID=A0A2T4BFG2_9HYPO|nr:acyl-CoA N-acyltransferase [Trichoderma citrinoviride]PTB68074.1 acyl-CoA N-acyltransferase [Trichoderma citrinoviride]